MSARDRLSLGFWYKNSNLREVMNQFEALSELLDFKLHWKKDRIVRTQQFGSILVGAEDLWIGISKHRKGLIAVDIYDTDGIAEQFESLLEGVIGSGLSPVPGESFLVKGEEEESGPSLFFAEDPRKCFEGFESIADDANTEDFTPQIRVINSSLGNLEEMIEIVQKHSADSRIIGDNLWIDFWWSEYSDSWTMGE